MGNFRSVVPNGLDRSRVADQIFKELRDGIVVGTIPQGAKLPSERELAQRYGVSGPTVREAIRGLTLLGLADVRHGSGAYVTADTESLIATSLSAVIQMGKPGVADVLSILGILNEHAARLATEAGTLEDLNNLRAALDELDRANTVKSAREAVCNFHGSIAAASHNSLLSALCGFLAEIQTELALELAGDSIKTWRTIFSKLKPVRVDLVAAIIDRDQDAAVDLAREFHLRAGKLINSLPKAKEVRLNDPKLSKLLSSMMTRVGPG